MKQLTGSIILSLAMLVSVGWYTSHPFGVSAQTASIVYLGTQTALTGCAWPTAYATVTNGMALCPLNLPTGPALAIAVNGGAFTQIPMTTAAAGVTSFNGRVGAVVPTANDYSYGQLSGLPTTTGNCTGGTVTVDGAPTYATTGVTVPILSANLTGCPF
jgi:hypothetical protein